MDVTSEEDFKQREIGHMRMELVNREQAIQKLVEINKVMEQKHHKELESLSFVFNERMKAKDQLIRDMEEKHSKELQTYDHEYGLLWNGRIIRIRKRALRSEYASG